MIGKQVLKLLYGKCSQYHCRHGLTIEASCRKYPNKSKLALFKPLLHIYSHLKQLYISNKMERFSYKGGCGIHDRLVLLCLKEVLDLATDKPGAEEDSQFRGAK